MDSRNKHRRDSGTIKDYLSEMQGFLEEVEEHVGLVVEEWLVTADDGEYSFLRLEYSFPANFFVQPRKRKTTSIFAGLTCRI